VKENKICVFLITFLFKKTTQKHFVSDQARERSFQMFYSDVVEKGVRVDETNMTFDAQDCKL
jgi:hypothetical protein